MTLNNATATPGILDVPIGTIKMFAGADAPPGFLMCDGSSVSRTTYALLFDAIGTAFGSGDGLTTFNLPNMAGRTSVGAGQLIFTSSFANTSVSVTSNEITVTSNDIIYTGTVVVLSTTGTAPAGLTAGNTYYAIRVSATVIKLATSLANAVAGAVIDITSQGTGTHSLTVTYTSRAVGDVGGEERHALTVAEIPSHTHNFTDNYGVQWSSDAFNTNTSQTDEIERTETTTATGGSGSHNIMQPYLAVNYIIKY